MNSTTCSKAGWWKRWGGEIKRVREALASLIRAT